MEDLKTAVLQDLQTIRENTDVFFFSARAMMIFFMQCGFAFLEAGAVRSRNTTNILIKNLIDSLIAALSFYAVGHALSFGEPANSIVGFGDFFSEDSSVPGAFFFHLTFAATAATIVSGALAERCAFVAYVCYSAVMTAHWAWAESGWLQHGPLVDGTPLAYKDFAGSGVIHMLGGSSALIGAAVLGPRIGRFPKAGQLPGLQLRGHSVPFAALGGFLLMFGFLAFNGGCSLPVSRPGAGAVLARCLINTILSGSSSALLVLLLSRLRHGSHWSLLSTINAVLTGMVAASAGCDVLEPWSAVVVGAVAGLAYLSCACLTIVLRIDDPLQAAAVHLGGGTIGILLTPIFMHRGVIWSFSGRSLAQLGWNILGGAAIVSWGTSCSLIVFYILKISKQLRVSEETERNGIDLITHGEPAYPSTAYGHGWESEEPKPRKGRQVGVPEYSLRKRKASIEGLSSTGSNGTAFSASGRMPSPAQAMRNVSYIANPALYDTCVTRL